MTRVTKVEPEERKLFCHGNKCNESMRARLPRRWQFADYVVTTEASQHAYHEECLPKKWRDNHE